MTADPRDAGLEGTQIPPTPGSALDPGSAPADAPVDASEGDVYGAVGGDGPDAAEGPANSDAGDD